MIHRLIPTAFLFVTLSGYALAQTPELQPAPVTMTPEQLTEAIVAIQAQLRELVEKGSPTQVPDPRSDVQKQIDQIKADVEQLKLGVGTNASDLASVKDQQNTMTETLKTVSDNLLVLSSQIKEVNTQLNQVRTNQDEFQAEISDEVSEITTQLGQISRSVGGSTTLRFDNIQDDATRQEFQDLVNQTIPRTGVLSVKNKMTTGQYVFINRVQHYIPAGTEERFNVPTGNASTQLPGQEVVNWSISAPNYRQGIQIVPDQIPVRTTVSLRPPVVYESVPIYTDPYNYITVR